MKKDAQPSRTNTRLINDAECSNTSTPILLALGILSIPHKGATRAYIRDSMTAANPPGEERVVHRFVIAGQGADFLGLNREGKAHGDLLILDKMSEGSESLSEKSLRWFMHAARSIPCARYVAKADPDTYIVWPKMRMQLGRMMTSGHLSPRLYFGVHCDWTWMLPQVRPHDVRPSTTALDCLARLPVRPAPCPTGAPSLRVLRLHSQSRLAVAHAQKCCMGLLRLCKSARIVVDDAARQGCTNLWPLLSRSNAEHPKWSQQHGSPIDGPFPYAAGLFYGVSAPVVKWLATSPFFANALRSLRRSVWSKGMRYTEDLVFGWVMRQVPELTTVVLGQGDGDAFDNFDAAGGVQRAFRQASECYLRYGLTAHRSKWEGKA